MADKIEYYFKETTNQVLVSGSSTTSGMNTLLTSPKNSPIVNSNTTAKISSLGANLTYLVQNGADDTTEITIADNQELWVYRGWQPPNTGDANAYRYNPHLHRPYKAYMLTETGSGTSASPFLPTGFPLYSNVPFNNGNILDIADKFDERVLGSNGNISSQERVNSVVAFSGSFTVENENRGVQPYVFTKYGSLPSPPGSGATIEVKDSTQAVVSTLVQTQTATGFPSVPLSSGNLTNGEYTFTSSIFNVPTPSAIGASQFGLYTQYADFVEYEASNLSTTDPVRVTFSSSDSSLTPVFFDLPADKKVTYTALVGTPSFTPVSGFTNEITNPSAPAVGSLPDLFSTRVNDVYISYSSSLSESIDGLYIFNQIPQSDVQVTVSMFLSSWTGVESGFQYGETNTTYSISPLEPHYGFDTDGGEPTFQTASISIYTGSYPSDVPTVLDDAYVTSAFSSSVIHQGLAVTMSTLIPSSSISLKDCLSVALSVSSGSANSASVEQALVVQTYELEFNTPSAEETGNGRVPVFIENAFSNTDGFANAVDCQPLYNLIVTDDTLRRNPLIQEIEYNIPENFQLDTNQRLLSSQSPFTPLDTFPFNAYEYDDTIVNATDIGKFKLTSGGTQVNSNTVEINNRYYEGGNSANTILFITDLFDIWENATNRIIKFPSAGGDTLSFNVTGNPTYTQGGSSSSVVGKYSISLTNGTTTGVDSPFSDGNPSIMELVSGEVMTDAVNIIVSQVPLPDGTLQITTTGTGTGLELDITSADLGTSLIITVSSPGRGHKNGDLLTIPLSVLSPIFGNAIVRDLQITLSFTFGLYNPSNFKAIQEGTAIKSTVPESFYTQTSSIIPRYVGAKSSANFLNSIDGLVGGFGRVPVIDYKTAYFAYCDQVVDLYPVINNKTLFNIKYLINEGGDTKQPNLSPYTAYDIQGSWQAGGIARVGVNQASGSTQYDVLNNRQSVYEVTKLPSPYLYSQTGASTFSTWIPLGSDTYNVSSNDDEFENYSMNIAGAPFATVSSDKISISLPNLVSGSNGSTIPNDYSLITYDARYGFSGSNPGGSSPTVFASSSIITSSTSPPLSSIYALPGEVFFNQDQFAIDNDTTPARNSLQPRGNQLSDSYTINLDAEFPSSPPHYIRTSPFGNKTTSTNGKDEGQSVGSIVIQLKSKDMALGEIANQDYTTDTGWNNEVLFGDDLEAIISINYGTNTNIEIDLKNVEFGGNKSVEFLTGTNKGIQINVMPQSIHKILVDNYGSDKGISSKGSSIINFNDTTAIYAKFIIKLKTSITLVANRRYRWAVTQKYNPVGSGQGAVSPVNLWNPTTAGINYINGEYELISPPIEGPFVKMSIEGKKTPSVPTDYDPFTDTKNFIAPFWEFEYSDPFDPDISPTPATMEPSASQTTLTLVSDIGNSSYGTGDIMGELNYTASANERFPGGLEPADSAFPFTGIPWSVIRPGDIFTPGGSDYDEIRFQNNENLSYKILNYLTPKENSGQLQLTLDGVVNRSVNIDFFLLRRYVYSPNTILINREFPYGALPVTKEFIPSTNVDLVNAENKTGAEATGSLSTSSQSGSIVTIYKPLTKADNTPSGILFPEFPTELIDLNPDEIIIDLRDKKLIE